MTEPGSGGGGLRNSIYRRVTRSQRRMTAGRRFLYSLAVPLGLGLIRLWWASCRVVKVEGQAHLDAALAKAPSLVPCFWHQHQLFCSRYLVEQSRLTGPSGAPRLKVGWLISPSVDGEIGAMMVQRFGGRVIRGSSTSTGALALRDYYEALVKQNVSPVITPDGPRGPRMRARMAARVKLALSGTPVLLLTATPIQNSLTELWGLVQYVEPTGMLLGDLRPADQTMVAIARALERSEGEPPSLLVLDEPTNALDAPGLELLESVVVEPRTLVVATHDPARFERRATQRLAFA